MNTASTKSGRKKQRARAAVVAEAKSVETKSKTRIEPAPPVTGIPENAWRIGVLLILLIAAVLRTYDLNLVPLHHDEGVNGNFLMRLVREGVYTYDPANYHGPTLYYFAAFFPWVVRVLFGKSAMETYGLTTVAIRMVPVLFGLGTIGLVFLLRRWLGTIATLVAALLLAISPGSVYLSRYFIHEMQFVFFTLGIVVAALYFYEKRNASYLMLASASAALLFATKETAMISAGVLIIAFAITLIYPRLYRTMFGRRNPKRRIQPEQGRLAAFVDELGGWGMVSIYAGMAVLIFASLWVAFYSSFFTHSKGVADSFKTFEIWTKTGTDAHVHPWYTYPLWLIRQEGPVLVLGALGAFLVVIRPKNAFALFSALWAFGLIAAYTLIPYKTPWLVLNFIVPLALIAGYAFQAIYFDLRLAIVLLLIPFAVSTYQTIDLNFKNYDNDDTYYVYVYAHTTRGLLDLVKEIDRIAREQSGGQTGITIVSPDYWPLPWYLRNYSRVGYFGRLAQSAEPIIIANENQRLDMEANYGEVYRQVGSGKPDGSFELRPGVRLLLYERRQGFTSTQPPSIRSR
ncbi:MAG TPA: flippase activity-associated protein Agl23 [Pyrinomonadaceae bacterium]|nr:flippase activity-associated protein Agl23 [Pyrinomonadaceae bacterium]